MTQPSAPDSTRTRISTAYWSGAYFVSVAALYLWAYWSSFDINVLEYVGLSDIVKTAAFPVASFFVFVVLGAVTGEAIFPHGFLPAGGGATSSVGGTLRRVAPAIAATYVLLVLFLIFFGPIEKWRALPVLIAIPVSLGLKESGFLSDVLKSDSARTIVIFLLAALPPFAYGHGTLRANDLRLGRSYSYVASTIEGHAVDPLSPVQAKPRYIGKAGETYFLYEPKNGSLLVVHQAQVKLLQLHAFSSGSAAKELILPASTPGASTPSAAASR